MNAIDNKTLWCGNLSEQVTEELLYELFLQAGPLEKVRIPKDRDGRQKSFAFVTFNHDVSVPYAINLFRGTALFHRTLSLQCREKMATLPPPIRCTSFEQSIEMPVHYNLKQQFADMTENIDMDVQRALQSAREYGGPDLVMASLLGNWSHRHHPYRNNGNDNRHTKPSNSNENHENRKQSRNWRDRRSKPNKNSNRYGNRNQNYRND